MSMVFFRKILNFLTEFFSLLAIFILPLYFGFYLETNEVFEFHKFFIFKVLFFILLFLWFLKFIFLSDLKTQFQRFIFLFKKYFWPFFVFLFFCFISIFWSVDRFSAFYGSIDRGFGFLNWFYLFLFFLFFIFDLAFFNDHKIKIKKILNIITLSASVVSVYAIFQFIGLDFFAWAEPAHISKRAFSFLGQPNFLGSFLLLSIPMSLYLFINENKFFIRIVYLLSFLVQILSLIFSGSRGAWLGFLFVLILCVFVLFYRRKRKFFYSSLAVVIFVLSILFFGNNFFSQRFQSSFDFGSGSSAARAWLYPKVFQAFVEKPWGYGLENQREALIGFYQKNWAEVNVVNVVFDRAHNNFLDILLTLGFVGLLLYIFLFVYFGKILYQNLVFDKKEKSENFKSLSLFLIFSFLSYIISLQFNFSSIATTFYFFVLLSLVLVINMKNFYSEEFLKEGRQATTNNKNSFGSLFILKFLLILMIFLFSFLGVKNEIRRLSNDYYFFQSKKYFNQAKFGEGILMFSCMFNNNLHNEYVYYLLDTIFGNYYRGYFNEKSLDYLAKQEIQKNFKKIDNRKILKNKNSFFYKFAEAKKNSIFLNEELAKKDFDFLLKTAPNYPDVYLNFARHKIIFNKFDEALGLLSNINFFLPQGEIKSDISRNRLNYYKNLINYEMDLIYFKIKNNSVE